MKNFLKILFLSFLTLPAFAHAEDAIQLATRLLQGIGRLVGLAIPVVFGLAILAFFWGIFRYVFSQSGEDKREGKGIMLWSLVAVFIMVSLYGIITVLQVTFGVTGTGNFTPPRVNGTGYLQNYNLDRSF